MDERISKLATLANQSIYTSDISQDYIDTAPHIKHPVLIRLYSELLIKVYDFAAKYEKIPRVLDMGAGEGSTTLPFLELGAEVTAVDISNIQLNALQDKCKNYSNRLLLRCEDINDTLKANNKLYDIIVANSFLHHIPDYIGLIKKSMTLLSPSGQFFSFQDPLRYDSIDKFTYSFTNLAYFSWRIFKGNLMKGMKTRIRRLRGIYLDNCSEDNAEYHVTRNGVDQDAIALVFKENNFEYDIVKYFSTQSVIFQNIGELLKFKNTFGIIAHK